MSFGGINMKNEIVYSKTVGAEHLKKLGQFFTPYEIAKHMCEWILDVHGSVLDPAVGNAVFFRTIKQLTREKRKLVGYDIDPTILNFFDSFETGEIHLENYLTASWKEQYDCIICNPPYNKFQSIKDRDQIYKCFADNGYDSLSRYTNQYILFLIKALAQLAPNGRLAFIIPSEFLNSKYGKTIKHLLISSHFLRTIINFQNDDEVFFNSTTTCCIVFVEKSYNTKDSVEFVNLTKAEQIEELNFHSNRISQTSKLVSYVELMDKEKWLSFLENREIEEFLSTVDCKTFFKASRGIATGDNDYFVFSLNKAQELGISQKHLKACICKSADAKRCFFEKIDFEHLVADNKKVFILDIKDTDDKGVQDYIRLGENTGVNKKYLPKHRIPWYKSEDSKIAPIWIASAGRGNIKVVRNLAEVSNLTTFHGIFVKDEYKELTDVIFLYLLTPIGQIILKQNKKELGNGLEKFQPNDINDAKMIDLRLLRTEQISEIKNIYREMKALTTRDPIETQVNRLNDIFCSLIK